MIKRRVKRLFAGLLATATLLTSVPFTALGAGQSSYLGTRATNGSPLVSQGFTENNWDSWEMLCFGVFLSNFCEPFADDYASAFLESSTQGSKGAGLTALEFSTGGDSQSEAYLKDMLDYCVTTQSKTMRPINVTYKVYEYGELQTDSGLDNLGSRQAYMDDLIPSIAMVGSKDTSFEVGNVGQLKFPLIGLQNVEMKIDSSKLDLPNMAPVGTYPNISVARYAFLPEFTVGRNTNLISTGAINSDGTISTEGKTKSNVIFDLADGWDIQVLEALYAKTFNTSFQTGVANENDSINAEEKDLNKYVGQKYPLYMDGFGNICIKSDNRYVVVIPASSNRHISSDGRINLVNSLILNSFVLGTQDSTVIANANAGITGNEVTYNGSLFDSSSCTNSGIPAGRMLVTTSTMPFLMDYIYDELRSSKDVDRGVTVETNMADTVELEFAYDTKTRVDVVFGDGEKGYETGESLYRILSDDPLSSSSIQLSVTGVDTSFQTTQGFWFWKKDIDPSVRYINKTLGALELLGNSFPAPYNTERLTEVIQYNAATSIEDTAQELFSYNSSYYLLPRMRSKGAKQFFNYACQALAKVITPSGQNYSVNANQLMSEIRKLKSPVDINLALLYENIDKSLFVINDQSTIASAIDYTNVYTGSAITPTDVLVGFLDDKYAVKNHKGSYDGASTMMDIIDIYDSVKPGFESVYGEAAPDTVGLWGQYLWSVRVLKPASYFEVATQVFGLSEGTQFELYTPQIYISYLNFYGLMDNAENSNNFNDSLFANSDFLSYTAKNFKSAKTEEEQEAEIRLNVYRMLSLDEGGDTYRESLIDRFIRTLFVKPFSKSLEQTDSLIGEKTGFLDVSIADNNFIVGAIINAWESISVLLTIVLVSISTLSGVLNQRKFSWHIKMVATIAATIFLIPGYLDIAPIATNRAVNSLFNETSTYWSLAESVRTGQQEEKINNFTTGDAKIYGLLSQLNFLDTDTSLMVKLDISRKIVDNLGISENDQEALQKSTLRWLLPTFMEQLSASDGSYDYVSVPLTQLYNNMSNVYNTYVETSYKTSVYRNGEKGLVTTKVGTAGINGQQGAVKSVASWTESAVLPDLIEKKGSLFGTGTASSISSGVKTHGYEDTSCNSSIGDASQTYKSISRLYEDTENVHTGFYLLQDFPVSSPYSDTYTGGDGSLSFDEWFDYAKSIKKSYNITEDSDGNTETNSYINRWYDLINQDVTAYNRMERPLPQDAGYFFTTEGLGVYFYTLVKDTFREGFGPAKKLANVMLNLQGDTTTDEHGDTRRESFMHMGDTGLRRDFLDLEEVFTNVMPYLYNMQAIACGDSETNGVFGNLKMVDSEVYADNYVSWAFRTNWVTKIYEDKLYGSSENVTWAGDDGSIKTAKVENICDPRSYPSDRPMIFSEAQMVQQDLSEEQLTIVELKCIEVGRNTENRWTKLLNYANMDGLDTEAIYRTMALEAWMAFNETFTNDSVFLSMKTLYPTSYDLRNMSFITMFRSMMSNITGNTSYVNGDIPELLYEDYGLFTMLFARLVVVMLTTVFPFFREVFMSAVLIFCILSVILNVTESSRARWKAAFGWLLTTVFYTAITCVFYWVISWFMADPVADKVIDTSIGLEGMGRGAGIAITLLLISIVAILYCAGISLFIFSMLTGKGGLSIKDGGLGFFARVTDNAFASLGNKITKGFSKFSGKGSTPADGGVAAEGKEKKQKVIVDNSASNPVKTEGHGGIIGIQETGHRYNNRNPGGNAKGPNISAAETKQTKEYVNKTATANIQKEIEKGMKMDNKTSSQDKK